MDGVKMQSLASVDTVIGFVPLRPCYLSLVILWVCSIVYLFARNTCLTMSKRISIILRDGNLNDLLLHVFLRERA